MPASRQAAVLGEVTPRRRPWGSHTPPPSLGKSHPAARRIRSAGAESARKRTRRPPEAGNRARRFRSSSLGDKLPRSVWATCVARVSPLPRSEWTPCRQSAALRRKSVGTSAAPPALRASAARGESRMESAPRPVRQSAALRGKAVGTSAAHIRRAAVRGLGTFTWGFLRHSPASVLARGKNRGESRVMTVVEAVGTFPHCRYACNSAADLVRYRMFSFGVLCP